MTKQADALDSASRSRGVAELCAPINGQATPIPHGSLGKQVALSFREFEANTIADGFSSDPLHRELLLKVPTIDSYEYGRLTPEIALVCGLKPMPVCLANGRHHGAYGGFGVAHILAKHGDTLAHWEYHSVQDFVDHTAQTFDAIYESRDRRWLLLSRTLRNPTMNRILVVEEGRAGDQLDRRKRLDGVGKP